MGARLTRAWLEKPCIRLDVMHERNDAIDELLQSIKSAAKWSDSVTHDLKLIKDLERLIMRISPTHSSPKEILALSHACSHDNQLKPLPERLQSSLLKKAY